MKIYIDNTEISQDTLQVEGVFSYDYPEYCDAYFSYAETTSGRVLTEQELDNLTDKYPELLNQLAHQINI
tara:strand:- start:390 stop:599 length:210 start_codon:yes stop_codon:yes gene_type:complete